MRYVSQFRDICSEAETYVCTRVRAMLADKPDKLRGAKKIIDEIERGQGIEYAPLQRQAVELAAQDRENEKIITTLEQEKQTVQEQAVQLLDKNEELQGQFEAAQADAQRLAYFRKSEIDPATYEMFQVGYDMLTPTEREILEACCSMKITRSPSPSRQEA